MKTQKLVVLAVLFAFCTTAYGEAEGRIQIVNVTKPFVMPSRLFMIRTPYEASDGYDPDLDVQINRNDLPTPSSCIYTRVELDGVYKYLSYDYRPADPNDDDIFEIHLSYYGSVASPRENRLYFDFYIPPESPFDGRKVLITSKLLKYGGATDIRKIIENEGFYGEPNVLLFPLMPGNYYPSKPYGKVYLHITNRSLFLCDIIRDGIVNWEDYSALAEGWGKPQGKWPGDITGIDGVPDGYVNVPDFVEFGNNWLSQSVDYYPDGIINLKDYAVVANNWLKSGVGDYTGALGFPDGTVNWRDLELVVNK